MPKRVLTVTERVNMEAEERDRRALTLEDARAVAKAKGYVPGRDPLFWAWTKWRDRGGLPADRPVVLPRAVAPWKLLLWYERYKLHAGSPVKPPPPTPVTAFAQNCLWIAGEWWDALHSPRHYRLFVSVDPLLRDWEDDGWIDAAREQGRIIGTWCDCWSTLAPEAIAAQRRYNFHLWSGQAERQLELDHALAHDAPVVVGKPGAWDPSERVPGFRQDKGRPSAVSLIQAGRMSVSGEAFSNAGDQWPETYSAQDVPVSSVCVAFYDAREEHPGSRGYVTAEEYDAHTPDPIWQTICAFTGGARPGELSKLP